MTSTSACRSARVAAIPAKPPPITTTRLRSWWETSTTAVASSGRVAANIALMDHLVRASLSLMGFSNVPSETMLSLQQFGFATACRRMRSRHFVVRGLARCRDCTELIYRDEEHREAQRRHDDRDGAQDVIHISSTHFRLAPQ